ncbi:MAG: SDR family oxidoreductase [Bryobacteraceae bacterium]
MKTAIVTGASQGIGRAIAVRLGAEGYHVILTGRNTALLEEAAAAIRDSGGEASTISRDLREHAAAAEIVQFAIDQTGRLDLAVSNAGATKRGEFDALTDDDFVDGFALKYFGAVRLTRAAWPHLKAAGGSIVYISGVGGRAPGRQFAVGGSVNAALLAFTKAIAETGVRDGVQVNAILPGTIRTARFDARLAAEARSGGRDRAEVEAAFIRDQGIRRIGEPEDVANLVAFVASEQGSLLHGALLDIDAGATKGV